MNKEAYFIVFLCGLADAITTQIGLSLGFTELNRFYAPFLSTIIFFSVFLLIDREDFEANQTLKEIVKAGLILVALSPVINNLQVMVSIIWR